MPSLRLYLLRASQWQRLVPQRQEVGGDNVRRYFWKLKFSRPSASRTFLTLLYLDVLLMLVLLGYWGLIQIVQQDMARHCLVNRPQHLQNSHLYSQPLNLSLACEPDILWYTESQVGLKRDTTQIQCLIPPLTIFSPVVTNRTVLKETDEWFDCSSGCHKQEVFYYKWRNHVAANIQLKQSRSTSIIMDFLNIVADGDCSHMMRVYFYTCKSTKPAFLLDSVNLKDTITLKAHQGCVKTNVTATADAKPFDGIVNATKVNEEMTKEAMDMNNLTMDWVKILQVFAGAAGANITGNTAMKKLIDSY